MTVKGNVTYADKVKRPYELQSKRLSPSGETQIVRPDSGFDGLSKVVVNNVTAAVDPDIIPENIRKGVEILEVVGTMEANLQSKTVTPGGDSMSVLPDEGYDGLSEVVIEPLRIDDITVFPSQQNMIYRPARTGQANDYIGFSSVTVKAVTADIDPAIQPGNIKKNINVLGVTGTFAPGFETVDSFTGELTGTNIKMLFKTITIPDNVESILTRAFEDCAGLESISLPVSLTSVSLNAFYGCTGLTDVYYAGTQEQWDAITIGDGNEALTNAVLHCQEV